MHIWRFELESDTRLPLLEYHESILDAGERRRHQRFVDAADRHRFLASHAFVRLVLSRYSALAPQDWRFSTNADGKPFLAPDQARKAPYFNLSHSGGMALLALSPGPCELGVDVELHRRSRRFMALAQHNFAPSEIGALGALHGDDIGLRFYDLWSLKESFVKARGMGLSLPLGEFSFEIDDATGVLCFASSAKVEPDPVAWSFFSYRLEDGFSAALAIRRSNVLRPRWFEMNTLAEWRAIAGPEHLRTRRITVH